MNQKDMKKIEKVVLISAIVLVFIGIIEIVVGNSTQSVGLVADGIDSLSDSVISFMVWFGLKISRRHADNKFHFGYHRVETLVSLMVALLMIGMSIYIFYSAYLRLLNPIELQYPFWGIIVLIVAGSVSLYLSVIKNRLARKHRLLSLQADAKTSTKDWTSSLVILLGLAMTLLGLTWGDAVGAFIVSIYIIAVAIATIKQASMVLIDSFNNPQLVKEISKIIKKYPNIQLKEMKLRLAGPYILGEITITVKNSMTIKRAYVIKARMEREIMEKIGGVKDLTILADPETV